MLRAIESHQTVRMRLSRDVEIVTASSREYWVILVVIDSQPLGGRVVWVQFKEGRFQTRGGDMWKDSFAPVLFHSFSAGTVGCAGEREGREGNEGGGAGGLLRTRNTSYGGICLVRNS